MGAVVLNRVKDPRFPKTICAVVYEPGQFSWAYQGIKYKTDKRSLQAAKEVLRGHRVTKALFFHSHKVNPGWKYKRIGSIGNHIFYK